VLVGGFQNVDMTKLSARCAEKDVFRLPLDADGLYTRQVFTNNGRTATIYLLSNCIDVDDTSVILLPDYLCLSVLVAFDAPKVKYRFYKINRDLSIDMASLRAQIDEHVKGIYIIPYFGVPYSKATVDELKEIRERTGILLIEDITQALLTSDRERFGFGDYIVGSTRKWFPMTDGGILASRDGAKWKDTPLADAYNEAAYKQLLITLIREYYDMHPDLSRESYLLWEKEANRVRYTDLTVRTMTEFSRSVLLSSDCASISARRIANYNYLYERLSGLPQISILSKPMDNKGHVPFGLVIMAQDRDELYHYLAGHDIIGEIQWLLPLEYYTPGADASYMSNHNLMLHCDQRYTEKDMELVADTLYSYYRQ